MTTIPELSTTLTSVDRAADLFEVSDTSDSGNSKKTSVNYMLNITSQPVGTNDVQTLTNKTITSPIVSSPVLSGTVTGTYTLGGTPTFPSSVVTLTGSQTLTNKVLTSPTINNPTIANPSITVDAISEYTSANGITIDGLNVKDGKLNTNNSVVTANITDSAVTGAKIATYRIVRQNNTSNTTETTARILTGWGVIAYNTGASNVNEAVTFDSAFTSAPIVTISFGGDHATLQTYGSGGNNIEAVVNAKAVSVTTTGFTAHLHKPTGNFAAGYGFYQWTAIGV